MLRLTGGEFRGRSIKTPDSLKTRPTQAKLRQALFNSIQMQIPDAVVLDLFSGSGALGFEALSRGAAKVVFVELSRAAIKMIEINAASLGVLDRIEILGDSVSALGSKLSQWAPFDIIMADPPYSAGWELKLLTESPWQEWLAPGGKFCLEWGIQKSRIGELPDRVPFLEKSREKNYGDSVLTTYSRSENENDPNSEKSSLSGIV